MAELDVIKHWDDLDAFAWDVARTSEGKAWRTMAISFVGDRPDLFVEAPVFVVEDADDILERLIGFFGALRPERLAVLWLNRFECEDAGPFWAVRVNSAWRDAPERWTWRTRLYGYTVDPKTRSVELFDEHFDLEHPPDPWSKRLRRLYARTTWRRIQRRGWFAIPDGEGWAAACHPLSTTLDAFERLDA
jgi:hypothetical protein